MAMLPTGPASELATRSDLERFGTSLRGEMGQLSAELRGEMAQLSAGLRGEMAELRGEMVGLKGELRGEIKAQLPRLYAANVLSMIGVAGLVLAALSIT